MGAPNEPIYTEVKTRHFIGNLLKTYRKSYTVLMNRKQHSLSSNIIHLLLLVRNGVYINLYLPSTNEGSLHSPLPELKTLISALPTGNGICEPGVKQFLLEQDLVIVAFWTVKHTPSGILILSFCCYFVTMNLIKTLVI